LETEVRDNQWDNVLQCPGRSALNTKLNMNLKLYHFHARGAFNWRSLFASSSVKRRSLVTAIIIRLSKVVRVQTTRSVAANIGVLMVRLYNVWRKQNLTGLVKFTKSGYVITQQVVAGYKLEDITPVGPRISRAGDGLPRVIPAYFRIRIRGGDKPTLRLILTIFSIYRVISVPGKLKLATIIDRPSVPMKNFDVFNQYYKNFILLFVPRSLSWDPMYELRMSGKSQADGNLASRENYPISKASPASASMSSAEFAISASHPWSAFATALAITGDSALYASLRSVVGATYGIASHTAWFLHCVSLVRSSLIGNRLLNRLSKVPLGKLGLKMETAGKVRVFAFVDPWTQWALYPLHNYLFRILRTHGLVDGTFNQLRPLGKLMGCKSLYSLDLSAATDRLPLVIQMNLLTTLFDNREFVSHWAYLLVGRGYSLTIPDDVNFVAPLGVEVRNPKGRRKVELFYGTGQPMGALSSWAMLAFTHHFIVQVAAWRAGFSQDRLFTQYAVLGDDVVIGHKAVADMYLHLIGELGVECGLAKSILSPFGLGLEFAKRTFMEGEDVSPISLREFAASHSTISSAISFMRKYQLSLSELLFALGYGYKVVGKLSKPFGKMTRTLRTLTLASLVPEIQEINKFLGMRSIWDKDSISNKWVFISDFLRSETNRLEDRVLRAFNKVSEAVSVLLHISKTSGLGALPFFSVPGVTVRFENETLNVLNKTPEDPSSDKTLDGNYAEYAKLLEHPDFVRLWNSYIWDVMKCHLHISYLDDLKEELHTRVNELPEINYIAEAAREWEGIISELSSLQPMNLWGVKSPRGEILEGDATPASVAIWYRWQDYMQSIQRTTHPTFLRSGIFIPTGVISRALGRRFLTSAVIRGIRKGVFRYFGGTVFLSRFILLETCFTFITGTLVIVIITGIVTALGAWISSLWSIFLWTLDLEPVSATSVVAAATNWMFYMNVFLVGGAAVSLQHYFTFFCNFIVEGAVGPLGLPLPTNFEQLAGWIVMDFVFPWLDFVGGVGNAVWYWSFTPLLNTSYFGALAYWTNVLTHTMGGFIMGIAMQFPSFGCNPILELWTSVQNSVTFYAIWLFMWIVGF
jgi:hypothetical protein